MSSIAGSFAGCRCQAQPRKFRILFVKIKNKSLHVELFIWKCNTTALYGAPIVLRKIIYRNSETDVPVVDTIEPVL